MRLRAVAVPVAVLGGAALLAGCPAASETVTKVTVSARPAVLDAATLQVTLGNDNATITEDFDVLGDDFPLSFTVTTPERSGELTIDARALASDGTLVGLGAGRAVIVPDDVADAEVLLEAADFVVNTSVSGSQRMTFFDGNGGHQLAAGADGSFTVGFSDDCSMLQRCDVYARRFDAAARPQPSVISADRDQFIVNQSNVFGTDPAVVTGVDGGTLVAWSAFDDVLAIAVTDELDHAAPVETVLAAATEPNEQGPAATALPGGGYAVVWADLDPVSSERTIRARLLDAAGQPAINAVTGDDQAFVVATVTGTLPDQPAVAATGDGNQLAFLWRDDATIFARFTTPTGTLTPAAQIEVVTYPGTAAVWTPRLVALDDFSLFAVWGVRTVDGAFDTGALIGRRFTAPMATALSTDTVLATGLPDVLTAPGLARRADGAVAVTWHACGSNGDGSGCAIWMQVVRESGLRVGPPARVNTTTNADQRATSTAALLDAFVVAWDDASATAPDTSGFAVRARVVYPAFDDASGVIGARCGGADDAPCGSDLACLTGSDDLPRCHVTCVPDGPAPQCPGGGVCTTSGPTSACIF